MSEHYCCTCTADEGHEDNCDFWCCGWEGCTTDEQASVTSPEVPRIRSGKPEDPETS